MELKERIELIEKRLSALEGRVQEQTAFEDVTIKSNIKEPFRILKAYDPKK